MMHVIVLSATGISSFSTFTGVKSTAPPANQELANIEIPGGVSNCYDATQHLTAGGNGTTFIVNNNGTVTLIAGNMVTLLPGVKVFSGGYLHAYISTAYCGSMQNPLVNNPGNEEKELAVQELKNAFIKIYPNPTTDYVVLEFVNTPVVGSAYVSIYNMNGKMILQQVLAGENKHQFSLSGQPVGIYMMQVRTDQQAEIAKIIKN